MEPLLYFTDSLASIFNQKKMVNCIERLEIVDEKLSSESIIVENKLIKRVSIIVLVILLIIEGFIVVSNFILHNENFTLNSLLWTMTAIPSSIDSLYKIWFLVFVLSVRVRLLAMNNYLKNTVELFRENKEKYIHSRKPENEEVFLGYLADEIFCTQYQKRNNWKNLKNSQTINKDVLTVKEFGVPKIAVNENLFFADKNFSVGEKMDKKLILICRMHDEICEIAKVINEMFSFHMLLTMAYSFLKITAELYFLYCSTMGQSIPFLFKSAENFILTVIFISHTAIKTIVVIFMCWKTKTECQKTGVYLHKIANVVDENHFYNVVNHLSLKLLNQQFNFTACGFFDLDMTTLYAVL